MGQGTGKADGSWYPHSERVGQRRVRGFKVTMDPEDRVTASGACLQVDARGSSTALAQPNTAKVEELLMHACDVGAAVVAMEEWIANKQTKTRTFVQVR